MTGPGSLDTVLDREPLERATTPFDSSKMLSRAAYVAERVLE